MREDMLKSYLETMRFLSQTTDEMMYLCDLSTQKIYFADNYAEKLQVFQIDGTEYTLEQMQQFMYAKNGQKVSFKLSSFENLADGLLHQEYYMLDKKGKKYKIHSTERLQFDPDGNPMWIIGHVSNFVTSQKVDELTRLFNSQKMLEDLTEALENKKSGFLVVLGIDNFKNINNKYGRIYGNHILKKMADTLDSVIDVSLKAYRLDSDKFAIHAVDCTKEEVEQIYHRIQEKVKNQWTLSSGAAEYRPERKEDANAIYQHAENALDDAKRNGKNKLEFFSETMYEELLSMIDFQEELKQSVENNFEGFSICYQPQIDTDSCTLCGLEALLRYESQSRGQVAPDEFIPILEQTELILKLGRWVLWNALVQCKQWRNYLPDLHVNVNLSFVQMKEGTIWEHVLRYLEEIDLPGSALTLELTESIHMQDYQSFNRIFYKLGKKGVKIAIDDFGTGYSSLSYLKSIAIDEIKVDRSFVSGIQYSAYNYRLLGNLIELAHSANIRVCCEGVETDVELQTLKELHPDMIQGYLFGKPLTVKEFEDVYICFESEVYNNARKKEQKYRLLRGRENSQEQNFAIHEKMAAVVDGMNEIIYVSDNDNYELMYLNASGRELTGMYDYNGRKCYEVMYGRKTPCEFCQKNHVGSESYHVWEWDNEYLKRHFLIKDKLIQWTGKMGHLTVCIDITEKEIMSKAAASKDPLTGVYNRKAFEEKMKQHMQKSNNGKASTLIMLDLDNFKMINDRYGHMEGDRVLKQMVEALTGVFRKQDLVGRLGGDEFLVFLKDLTDREIIARRMEEFRTAFAKVNGYHSTCSMGITLVEKENFSYNECLKKVDMTLYQSKEKGKDMYSYYEDM